MALKPHGVVVDNSVAVSRRPEANNIHRHIVCVRSVRPRNHNLIPDLEILLGKAELDDLPNLLVVGDVNRGLCNSDTLDRCCDSVNLASFDNSYTHLNFLLLNR